MWTFKGMIDVLMKRDYFDEELKGLILNFIMRKGRWGKHYFPIDTMKNWLSQVVQNNGRNIDKKIKELHNEGFLILHKRNTTVSLNPRMKYEILEYIKKNLRE